MQKSTTILALALTVLLSARGAAAKGLDAWQVVQRTDYAGQQVCFISPGGVKLVSRIVTTLVEAPSKKVTLYRDDSGSYCELTYKEWMSQIRKPGVSRSRQIIKGKSGKVAGVDAMQYLFENIDHGRRRVTEEYWTATNKVIPTKYTAPLSDLADLPEDLGLPLKITQLLPDGHKKILLETLSLSKAKPSECNFKKPVGYKKVTDPIMLVLGGKGG
jgi:hypothetical protein